MYFSQRRCFCKGKGDSACRHDRQHSPKAAACKYDRCRENVCPPGQGSCAAVDGKKVYSEKEKIAAFIDEALPSLDAVAKAAIPNVRHTTMDAVMACLFRTISSFCFVGFRLCVLLFFVTIKNHYFMSTSLWRYLL